MEVINDIDYLISGQNPYDLQYSLRALDLEPNVNTNDARREWKGIPELFAARLKDLGTSEKDAKKMQSIDAPFVFHFWSAYHFLLGTAPEDISNRRQLVRDMIETLQTIRSLDEIMPFTESSIDRKLADRLSYGVAKTEHILNGNSSMLDLEQATVKGWNERRNKVSKPSLQPWDELALNAVVGDPNITALRIFPKGANQTLGFFVFRSDPAADDDFSFLDYACDDIPTMPEILVQYILFRLQDKGKSRLKNLLEETHPREN